MKRAHLLAFPPPQFRTSSRLVRVGIAEYAGPFRTETLRRGSERGKLLIGSQHQPRLVMCSWVKLKLRAVIPIPKQNANNGREIQY